MADAAKDSRPSAKPAIDEDELFRSDLTPLISGTALGARTLARCFTRVRVEGAIDAIPREGPVILASNHISNADGVVIGAWLTPRLGRRIHWLGKREMFDWPVVGWMARNGGIVPVDRSTADVEAFRLAQRVLQAGEVLMVFPEGTRSPTAELQKPKDGLAMLALRTDATIVPIGVSNTDRVWPKGRPVPRFGGHATLRVGQPFRLEDELPAGLNRKSQKAAATDLIMHRIAAQLDPRHRGSYAE
jgi:1-acyl-sn-glycerol-3-phosphate acyltransferase